MNFFETHSVYIRMIDPEEGYVSVDANKDFVRKYRKGYQKIFKNIFNTIVGDKEAELPKYEYFYFFKERNAQEFLLFHDYWKGGDVGTLLEKLNKNIHRKSVQGAYVFNKFVFKVKGDFEIEGDRAYEEEGTGLKTISFSNHRDYLELSYMSYAVNEVVKTLPNFQIRQWNGGLSVTKRYTRHNLMQYSDFNCL